MSRSEERGFFDEEVGREDWANEDSVMDASLDGDLVMGASLDGSCLLDGCVTASNCTLQEQSYLMGGGEEESDLDDLKKLEWT